MKIKQIHLEIIGGDCGCTVKPVINDRSLKKNKVGHIDRGWLIAAHQYDAEHSQ